MVPIVNNVVLHTLKFTKREDLMLCSSYHTHTKIIIKKEVERKLLDVMDRFMP